MQLCLLCLVRGSLTSPFSSTENSHSLISEKEIESISNPSSPRLKIQCVNVAVRTSGFNKLSWSQYKIGAVFHSQNRLLQEFLQGLFSRADMKKHSFLDHSDISHLQIIAATDRS